MNNFPENTNAETNRGIVFRVILCLVASEKNESKENYFWSIENVWLIFKDCFALIFFFFFGKTTLSHSKLNKGI